MVLDDDDEEEVVVDEKAKGNGQRDVDNEFSRNSIHTVTSNTMIFAREIFILAI